MNTQSQWLFEVPWSHESDREFVANQTISNLLLTTAASNKTLDQAGVYRITWQRHGKKYVYDGKAGGGSQTVRQRLQNHLWCLTHLGGDPTKYRVSVQLGQGKSLSKPSQLYKRGKEELKTLERKRINESRKRGLRGKVISTNQQREREFLFELPSMSNTIFESEDTAATAWKCRADGVPCPPDHYDFLNPKGACRLTDCRKAKTYREPLGISPGTCTYRCPQGSVCSGPMFGKSWAAFVPFVLCD